MKAKLMKTTTFRMTVLVFILLLAGSRVSVSAHPLHDSRTDFVAYVASSAQSEMRDSGVPASFSIGQSAHETGFNRFPPHNNFHGIKCPGPPRPARCESNWRAYNTPGEAFLDHGHWLTQNTRYANAFNYVDDPAQFAREVASAGYSEGNPSHYANVVIGYINQYNLTQYDNQNTPFVGVFYTNRDLSGRPVWVSQTQNLSFDWGGGSPNWRIGVDNFSVRWKAKRRFRAGRYRFHTSTDDGVRLWVDGNLVIDRWRDQPPTEWTGNIDLSDGFHWVRMEYYERGGGAVARLWWERIGSGPISCPNQYRAEYFNNRTLSGGPTFVQCEGWPISHDWGSGGPGRGVGNDNFSARWTGRAHINAGTYTFVARADDGIRVWVGSDLVVNEWHDQPPTEYRVTRHVNDGYYDIKVEYYENGGGAVAQFRWERVSSSCSIGQYRAEYYNNRALRGSPTFVRCENPPINYDWGSGGPGHGVGNDNFSVRWTGRFNFDTDAYTFYARTDDGIRLYLAGSPIIDAWRDQAPTEYRVGRFVSGEREIKVEYYENGGGAVAQVRWEGGGSRAGVRYQAHVAGLGWLNWVGNGDVAGTTGQSRQMEATRIRLESAPPGMRIKYRAHVAQLGWLNWVYDGAVAGTTGQGRRMEAVQIQLEGNPASLHVCYQAHVAGYGWLDWVCDGAVAGTTGQARRMEALRVRVESR